MSDEDDLTGQDDEPDELPSEQPTVNAASIQTVKKLERRKKRAQRESDEFWRGIFSTEIGRREMWNWLSVMHPFEVRLGYGPVGFPDERETWMRLSEQLLGQRVYQTWQSRFPDEIALMLQENDPRFQKPKRGS